MEDGFVDVNTQRLILKQTLCFRIVRTDYCFTLCSDHGLARLVEAYRAHGHKAAKINPLLPQNPVADSVPEINMLRGALGGRLDTSGITRSSETHSLEFTKTDNTDTKCLRNYGIPGSLCNTCLPNNAHCSLLMGFGKILLMPLGV